jgi:hypothetical protein
MRASSSFQLETIMIFKSIIACTLLTAATAVSAAPPLYRLQVAEPKGESAKPLNMVYQEISRTDEVSLVEVTYVSGASVPSSMFILRGDCGVAKARGKRYFKTVQVSKDPTRFELRFPATANEARPANIADKIFSREECELFGM